MADSLGVIEGQATVRPFMNEQNDKNHIAQFAQEFRSWFNNDKAKALAEYEFGTIGRKSTIPFSSAAGQQNYLNDAFAVGPQVKDLLKSTLVENYFAEVPKAMRFSIGFTDREGGDLETGLITTAAGEKFISVRILCKRPGPG
jgi:hypothetical protein